MRIFLLTIFGCLVLFGCSNQPTDVDSLRKAGQDAFLAGNYRDARAFFTDGLAKKPSDQEMLYYMGLAYKREYMYDSALFYLKKVDLLHPKQREITQEIYEVAPLVEDWESAVKAIKTLILFGDPEEKYWEELVDYHDRRGYVSLCYHFARKLLAREPENLEWYIRISSTAITLDSFEVASRVLDSAEERFGPRIEFTSGRGLIHLNKSEFEEAEQIFRGLHVQDTTNRFFRLYLGSSLAPQGAREKKEEALDIFSTIIVPQSELPRIDSIITTLREELGLEN